MEPRTFLGLNERISMARSTLDCLGPHLPESCNVELSTDTVTGYVRLNVHGFTRAQLAELPDALDADIAVDRDNDGVVRWASGVLGGVAVAFFHGE